MPAEATTDEPEAMIEELVTAEGTLQVVVFTLAGEEYGVDILDVRRIIRAEKITMIPNAPDFLKGVINLRSQIIAVVDLEKRFLLRRDEHASKHILVVEIGNITYGLLVDEVTEILRLTQKNIKPAPQIVTKKLGADFVKGVGTVGNKLVVLLDLEKVLSEKELVELSKISTKANRAIGQAKEEKKIAEQRVPAEKLPEAKQTKKGKTIEEQLEKSASKSKEETKPKAPKEKLAEETKEKTSKITSIN